MRIIKEGLSFDEFITNYADDIEHKIVQITGEENIDPDEYDSLAKGLYSDYKEFGDSIFDDEEDL